MGKPDEKDKDRDNDPTMEQEFNIGGWDPYLVEVTKVKRDKDEEQRRRSGTDRRSHVERRKS